MWFNKKKAQQATALQTLLMKEVDRCCMTHSIIYKNSGSEKYASEDPDRMIAYHLGALDAAFQMKDPSVGEVEFMALAVIYGIEHLSMSPSEAGEWIGKAFREQAVRMKDWRQGGADYAAMAQQQRG